MTALTKFACALLLTGGLAAPAWAGDAGTGQTTGATSTNQAGSMGQTTGGQTITQGSMNGQNGTNGQSPNAMNAGPGGMQVSETLKNDLSKAGFTDIQIMPSSFLVHAKDSQGNPVIMVINPNSVTALTEETQPTGSASNATHGSTNNSSNSAGATPGPNSTGGSQPVTPGGATKP